jgi:hypothetical protein
MSTERLTNLYMIREALRRGRDMATRTEGNKGLAVDLDTALDDINFFILEEKYGSTGKA